MSIKAILVGAGVRGATVYAPYALKYPDELTFVAVAEPDDERRTSFAKKHHIPVERQYKDWKEALTESRDADAVMICTHDRMHYEQTMNALELDYHVLLEKPISPFPMECLAMERKATEKGRLLTICHVLRYTPFWSTINRLIRRGDIGNIVSIQLTEHIGFAHMAHSYVRGHWNRSEESSPLILSKSCHDLDLIAWLMGQDCKRISSFGSLTHFRPEHAPAGAPKRCSDGCPHLESCCYADFRYYLGEGRRHAAHFTEDLSDEGILRALPHTPYGRCVYACDNDVVDHQIVNMEFKNGATAAFHLSAFTHDSTRRVHIMGTHGEIQGSLADQTFNVFDFASGSQNRVQVQDGGKEGTESMLREFCRQVKQHHTAPALTSIEASIQSHMLAFAAEESRVQQGTVIDLPAFIEHRKHQLYVEATR
ncbi:Gfo/Idh/MocA family protein [Paenibacillus sp. 1001270B_150601_E10]|uniref:Gfo/Idh/MocA family protein n=1 Tax=Paenibacillus sp. 1001270B_150601_E10 TaxID=2787079 RepID=UPI00189EBCEA|nr:Gfo/Idh/MocA family oxidoreductase [Paenibacillus sp. 1001270B_150601_E10]